MYSCLFSIGKRLVKIRNKKPWGVFNRMASASHVCPQEDGYPKEPHELSVICICNPKVDWESHWKKPLITHRDLRGLINF